MIANVLFDLDGTLTDPFTGITRCIHHALDGLGRSTPPGDDLAWCIGPPLRESFATLLDTDDDAVLDDALALYRKRFGDVGMFENAVYDGVAEMLGAAKAGGLRLFVATSKPHVFARPIVALFKLEEFFDDVWGSELDGTRTEKAKLLKWGLNKHRLAATTTLMVGDRRHDTEGAKANGARALAVSYGYGTIAELQAAGPDHLCGSPAEVTDVILQLSARKTES